MKKRLLSLFLSVMMLLTLVPVTALASTGGIEVKSIEYAGIKASIGPIPIR